MWGLISYPQASISERNSELCELFESISLDLSAYIE